jgi:hypothetical protein
MELKEVTGETAKTAKEILFVGFAVIVFAGA